MPAILATTTWTSLDVWIVAIGAISGVACALPGVFLLLRRMSMMGDAISHAVLPGLALAFLLTNTRDPYVMLTGAAIVGVLTAVFTQWIHSAGRVDEGASMGVVFTVLFALGLILIVQAANHVDLDPGCVLYGDIEAGPLETLRFAGLALPRSVWINGGVLVINAAIIFALYKEFRISTFDPTLSTTLGINATFMRYLLMTLVAITTVAAFETVGSILVIAMLIVPAATARMWSDRLGNTLLVAAAVAALSAPIGHWLALEGPAWFGYPGVDTKTAGGIAIALGGLFALSVVFAPRHGVVSKALHRLRLSVRVAREDLLGLLHRLGELGRPAENAMVNRLMRATQVGPITLGLAMRSLRREGLVTGRGRVQLSQRGAEAARDIVRSHRLWETYLEQHLALPADHLHHAAELLEHVTSPEMREGLERETGQPELDPHGKPIPRSPD
ncbi:MAG: metal ABC transporter permease [Phycisphaerales bacterium]|nr:metal ABC transporter permease [Phycisphaerales bacterium]